MTLLSMPATITTDGNRARSRRATRLIPLLASVVCLITACTSGPILPFSAPRYAGTVTPITEPVQFTYAPTGRPWPLAARKEAIGQGRASALWRGEGTFEIREEDSHLVMIMAFEAQKDTPAITVSVPFLPNGQLLDARASVGGKTVSAVSVDQFARMLAKSSLPPFKAGGYRQGEIVQSIDMRDIVPGLGAEGSVVYTLAGRTTVLGRPGYLLKFAGVLSASKDGNRLRITMDGYTVMDARTGTPLRQEVGYVSESPPGHPIRSDLEHHEVTPP
jgi:hypothetical protein